MVHSLLNRQLKKCQLDEETCPEQEQWQDFLERINRAYTEADQERYLIERSLMISSQEMQEVYEQLRESETRYALAAQGANDGLWDWDLVTGEVYHSPRWMEILGIGADENILFTKKCWLERIHPDDRDAVADELKAHLKDEAKNFRSEHRILHTDGEYRWVLIRGMAVRDSDGKAFRIAGSMSDITERKSAEEKLAHDAVHDALTGLPNRKKLMARLGRSIQRIKHNSNYGFAVLFIDLDRFKTINDSLGHQAGDELLLIITEKLTQLVRPSDMVARLGGDEFVVVLENVRSRERVSQIAERILNCLQEPNEIAGHQIYSSASIGIVLASPAYDQPDDLVRDADIAMYRAKVKGKARFEIYNSKMHSGAISLLQMEMDLRRAIDRDEFTLHYQPIVSLNSEKIVGFEALIRWNHPTRGIIMPNDFISVAEETGLILPIGNWVLREACVQMQQWREEYSLANSLVVNVNLSARQLEQKDLVEQITRILKETKLDPACLKLEITESVIMKNAEETITKVLKLREMGVLLSIDDFGTGYSSLSYLHRFPIDTLKVDRSFVNLIGAEGEHSEIIQTIITLAFNLGMDVVAEGVETAEQLEFLRQVNCNYGQGHLYSRPVTNLVAADMIKELKRDEFIFTGFQSEDIPVNEKYTN